MQREQPYSQTYLDYGDSGEEVGDMMNEVFIILVLCLGVDI